jgi:putative ABC transport system ATP-binding protein
VKISVKELLTTEKDKIINSIKKHLLADEGGSKIIMETVALSKIYGQSDNKIRALSNCNLTFDKGSFTSIIGRSGSGKSTLLHLLGGLDTPSEGKVLLEGQDIYSLNDSQRTIMRRRRIGFVFQFFNLLPELTAYQNILLPIHLDGRKQDKSYIDEIIEMLGLEDRLGHYAGELSGGQQQRVAIARALVTKPAVILADEPTGNLDVRSGQDVIKLLYSLRQRFHQTIILVTHDSEIAAAADRAITIKDGQVTSDLRAER